MSEKITGECTVIKDNNTEAKFQVYRDEHGKFHCEHLLKGNRCNVDRGKCYSRRYLPYLEAIDISESKTAKTN